MTIDESKIDDNVFKSIYNRVISNIQKFLKGSGWIINSVIEHNVNTLKYNPSVGSNYIELPEESKERKKFG